MFVNQQIFVKFRIFLHKHAPWINQNLSKFYEIVSKINYKFVSKINYKFRLIVGLYARKSDFGPCEQQISHGMRFPTILYVRPAKPQISLRIRAVWSEPLLVA